MLQYRVYLFDPDKPRPERPIQGFFNHPKQVEEWAKRYLESSGPNAEVWVYRMEEILEGSYSLKKGPKEEDERVLAHKVGA